MMQEAFMNNIAHVKASTLAVEKELKELNQSTNEELPNNEKINSTVKLIEKLSIQNEYKLNLLKDFSTYTYLKK